MAGLRLAGSSIHELQAPAVRVAIYTRKSVTEGLDQEFNTLDAQREAVEAYISSQRSAGWEPTPENYDDGGFTGSNIDRPAFKRLMADIEAGAVDVVAVYKLDRLSRSLADFARLMEVFERHGVTFVSVTQQFNSTSSMGRFTLNILMSFAEFERETIAERTRDKIQAARRRGLWTGGRPVLGYDVVDKRLAMNEAEATRVRAIFDLYLDRAGLMAVVHELRDRGWRGKTWTNKRGIEVIGGAFTKDSVHKLLTNPLYVGQVRAGKELVEGAHDAIVNGAVWEDVQRTLASKRPDVRQPRKRRGNALLQGLARCSCGAALTPTFTTKGTRRYCYYVCSARQKEGADACPGSRVAAGELEAFVVGRIRAIGTDPMLFKAVLEADQRERDEFESTAREIEANRTRLIGERTRLVNAIATGDSGNDTLASRVGEINAEIATLVSPEMPEPLDPDALRNALAEFDGIWDALSLKDRARALALLIEEVQFDASKGEIQITFRPGAALS